VTLLLYLFSLGHALEGCTLGRARRDISALADLAPSSATIPRDDHKVMVAFELMQPGYQVVVRSGERIGVDRTSREGRTAEKQIPILGMSAPVQQDVGARVFAESVIDD